MKILFMGVVTRSFAYDNWLQELRKQYEVTYISLSVLIKLFSIEELIAYVMEIAEAGKFDYIFFYEDNAHQFFPDKLFEKLKTVCPVLTFYPDDEPEVWCNNNMKYDHRYQFIATHSKRGMERHRLVNSGSGTKIIHLQWGYQDADYYKISVKKKKYDVVFVGTNFYNAAGSKFDGDIRREILIEAYGICKKHGYDFTLFGNGWETDEVLSSCYGGWIGQNDIVRIINESKAVLGLGYSADNIRDSYHTKLRHFEIAGCGSYQIVNENPELREIFGNKMGYFRTMEELEKEIVWAMEHEAERERRAEAMCQIASSTCTMQKRIENLFYCANQFFNKKVYECQKQKSNVEIVRVGNAEDIKNIISGLKSEGGKKETEYIQLIDKDIQILDYNDTLTKQLPFGADMIQVKTLLSFWEEEYFTEANLRRRLFEPYGLLLDEKIHNDHVNYEDVKAVLMGMDTEKGYQPLLNYIIRREIAVDVLRLFLAGDQEGFSEFKVKHLNRVIVEAAVVVKELPRNEVVEKLIHVVNSCVNTGEILAFYGAGGVLFGSVLDALKSYEQLNNIIFIDRNEKKKKICFKSDAGREHSYKVYQYERLSEVGIKPDVIVIVPKFSAMEIYHMLEKKEEGLLLLLEDMRHENWRKI